MLRHWGLRAFAGMIAGLAVGAGPDRFVSRGAGGGGAFFAPSINPFFPDEVWVGSDMSDLFHSGDFGQSWDTVDFRVLQGGNAPGRMEFTSDPRVRYALNGDVPMRTGDGGASWTPVPPDPYSQSVYCLYVDPFSTNRLVVSDYTTLKISTNSGKTYASCFASNDLLVAGVWWEGARISVATRPGLVVSTNGGASFAFVGKPGIPATEELVSFAGAREGSTLRWFAITFPQGNVWPGIQGSEYLSYMRLYRLDGGTGTWVAATNGIGANRLTFVAMCRTNVSVAYAAGADSLGQPVVVKTTNGGGSWSQVLQCTSNQNVATGWTGDDPGGWNWKKWSYGECAMGFTVCPGDPNRAVISDFGFLHVTTNGGATWRQAYDWSGCENAVGVTTPKTNFYQGNGAEDTSCWSLTWLSSNTVFAGFTDMRALLSTNGGRSWMCPMSLSYNSTYQAVRHPTNGFVYAAMSSVHDLYAWDRYCQDAYIDGGSGAIMMSTNQGGTWTTLRNLGRPVVGLALDPMNPNRLYAAMVNSASGGVYRTTNLAAGAAATWTRLGSPPRTQGHPYTIAILNDGTIAASYSARIASNAFQASSGVFVSTNEGASWLDRSAVGMRYYTKDLTIDPYDPGQNRWYAGVWGEWGASANLGGVYVTTNRGITWSVMSTNLKAVGSCTVSAVDSNVLYVCTEDQGLWCCTNRFAATPVFESMSGYPFRFPSRLFFNPYDPNEVWVTSFGNGLRVGRLAEPRPWARTIAVSNGTAVVTLGAAHGQKVALSASADLVNWSDVSTNVAFTDSFSCSVATQGSRRFFRAEIR